MSCPGPSGRPPRSPTATASRSSRPPRGDEKDVPASAQEHRSRTFDSDPIDVSFQPDSVTSLPGEPHSVVSPPASAADTWAVGGVTLSSRVLLGTSRYPSLQTMLESVEASGAEVVTVSVRRVDLGATGDGQTLLGSLRQRTTTDGRPLHLLPNILAPIIVLASTNLGIIIFIEASLSFLGFGTPPPTPSWGRMLSGTASGYFQIAWWLAFFPGLVLSLTILGVNLLGDALRDIWDPRLRGR